LHKYTLNKIVFQYHIPVYYIFLKQDIKYSAEFRADTFEIEATNFYIEPLAKFLCTDTASDVTGSPTEMYSGAGHASQGGGHSGKYDVQREKKNSKNK